MDIKTAIHTSDSIKKCLDQTRDCLTVAVALREFFGGEIILFTEIPEKGFNHAVLKKDGKYYDGCGLRSFSDIISMHISKEKLSENPEDHIYKIENPEKEFPACFDEELKKEIIKDLKQF